ncbi:SIS domain-containing protein [Tissierella sp. MSJ-40]|uniref:SIS domain-containing protein n=1 Tax=Tissierella simiarum TaxID=2841534 RepID=A0ABS6E1S3_9FIRM|nr:SIS domain-containing protein [Tissierella simiarum]MBU5436846.1 SIS domain-containing protein [Tissierella simiarum]
MGYELYFNVIEEMIRDVKETQENSIKKAGEIIADSIMAGGIIQAFGSGHSYAGAIEIAGRAGGLIPAKVLEEPSRGRYEVVEGVGTKFMEQADIRDNDCFVLISNSGRNPLIVEIADIVKQKGNKIIAVTSLDISRTMTSRHSSGKKLYDFADVVLDNRGVEGDAAVSLSGMPNRICGTSSITAAILLNASVLEAVEIMLSKGYTPPVYMSENVDGGPDYNKRLVEEYADRLYRR